MIPATKRPLDRKRERNERKTRMKKALKIIKIIFLTTIGILLLVFIVLIINSPGKLEPLKNSDGNIIAGSMSEKGSVEIGGIRQGYFIRAENPENPVMLFLHGGPGSPGLPIIIPFETAERLEKYFTVVYWEQRGAGMSFCSSIDPSTMTVEQMLEDTREMTEYLRKRFNQEKIFLIGHSWGSYLGIRTIEKYPELYRAFIGVGQLTNQSESERLAYDFMLRHAKKINDRSAIRSLKKFDRNSPDFPQRDYIMTARTKLMEKYRIGVMRDVSAIDLLIGGLFFKGYTLSEKINYARGSLFTIEHLLDIVMRADLFERPATFQVPIYILHGIYDYKTSYTLARKYYEIIEAPKKAFFSFENSAHSPNTEEMGKFVQIVRNIALEVKEKE